MDMATRVRIIYEAFCISHNANTSGKGMNPTILPLAMSKIVEQIGHFNLGMTTDLGEGKFCIQTC